MKLLKIMLTPKDGKKYCSAKALKKSFDFIGTKVRPADEGAPTEPKLLLFVPYKQEAPTGAL